MNVATGITTNFLYNILNIIIYMYRAGTAAEGRVRVAGAQHRKAARAVSVRTTCNIFIYVLGLRAQFSDNSLTPHILLTKSYNK